MEYNKAGERIISVVRVIEYRGTENWIHKTLEASRVPPQGVFKGASEHPLPEGHEIKSGLVNWSIVPEEGEVGNEQNVIPIPPGSGRTH